MVRDEKIVKNHDGGLKVPLCDLVTQGNVMLDVNVMLDAKIPLVPTHQLRVPSTLLNKDDLKGKVYL